MGKGQGKLKKSANSLPKYEEVLKEKQLYKVMRKKLSVLLDETHHQIKQTFINMEIIKEEPEEESIQDQTFLTTSNNTLMKKGSHPDMKESQIQL